jgi:hypothetical protein
VACGLWLVACGLWLVACGLWLVACFKHSINSSCLKGLRASFIGYVLGIGIVLVKL